MTFVRSWAHDMNMCLQVDIPFISAHTHTHIYIYGTLALASLPSSQTTLRSASTERSLFELALWRRVPSDLLNPGSIVGICPGCPAVSCRDTLIICNHPKCRISLRDNRAVQMPPLPQIMLLILVKALAIESLGFLFWTPFSFRAQSYQCNLLIPFLLRMGGHLPAQTGSLVG